MEKTEDHKNDQTSPGELVKVMQRRWAEHLLSTGTMRFGSLAYYRTWENDVLGDPSDGQGMFCMKGQQPKTPPAHQLSSSRNLALTSNEDRYREYSANGGGGRYG